MIPYTGKYTGYKENDQSGFTYYSFTPTPLMSGDFYTMDDELKEAIDIRRKQIFLSNVKANLKIYNPTAPDALLPALADIFAFLRNSQEDMLIKIPLVHYQFEMLHPYEKYNGIVGRIMVSQLLSNIVNEAFSFICLSEFLYWNKNQ